MSARFQPVAVKRCNAIVYEVFSYLWMAPVFPLNGCWRMGIMIAVPSQGLLIRVKMLNVFRRRSPGPRRNKLLDAHTPGAGNLSL